MTSMILKKRKLCEAIEDSLQIKPSSFEVKRRIDEQGEYKQLYESIVPQLRTLFPDLQDNYLLETLKAHNNDIISTIDYLKYHKSQTPQKSPINSNTDLDGTVNDVLNQLSQCQDRNHAYDILHRFKNQVIESSKEKLRSDAENSVLKKAFKIQRRIIAEESFKRKNAEKLFSELNKELERSKSHNLLLMMRLNQLEKCSVQSFGNDHIY